MLKKYAVKTAWTAFIGATAFSGIFLLGTAAITVKKVRS